MIFYRINVEKLAHTFGCLIVCVCVFVGVCVLECFVLFCCSFCLFVFACIGFWGEWECQLYGLNLEYRYNIFAILLLIGGANFAITFIANIVALLQLSHTWTVVVIFGVMIFTMLLSMSVHNDRLWSLDQLGHLLQIRSALIEDQVCVEEIKGAASAEIGIIYGWLLVGSIIGTVIGVSTLNRWIWIVNLNCIKLKSTSKKCSSDKCATGHLFCSFGWTFTKNTNQIK